MNNLPALTRQTQGEPGGWVLDSRYYFVWDGWNLSMELDGDMNAIRSYGWGLDLSRSEQGAGGVGGLLFATHHTGPSAGTYHTAYDGNGNLVSLRSSAGLAVARYEYGPFGETVTSRDVLAGVNPFRFSTKYQDAETGLLYYGYRYYSAGMGRWMSRDPIGENGGININAFDGNCALSEIDALGLGILDLIKDHIDLHGGRNFSGKLASVPLGTTGCSLEVFMSLEVSMSTCRDSSCSTGLVLCMNADLEMYVSCGKQSRKQKALDDHPPINRQHGGVWRQDPKPARYRSREYFFGANAGKEPAQCPANLWDFDGELAGGLFVRGGVGAFWGGTFEANLDITDIFKGDISWIVDVDELQKRTTVEADLATGVWGASIEIGGRGSASGCVRVK